MNPCRTRAKVSIFILSLYCTTYFLHGSHSDQNKTQEQLLAPVVPASREGFHLPRSVGLWTRAFGEGLKPTTCVTTHSDCRFEFSCCLHPSTEHCVMRSYTKAVLWCTWYRIKTAGFTQSMFCNILCITMVVILTPYFPIQYGKWGFNLRWNEKVNVLIQQKHSNFFFYLIFLMIFFNFHREHAGFVYPSYVFNFSCF